MSAMPIVDSHVHLWNPAQFRYAWLDGLPTLNRKFLPEDFSAASANANVRKMIFVECDCEPAQNLAEVDWISDLAKIEPRLKSIVAFAPLEKGEAVRVELEKLAAAGVRSLPGGTGLRPVVSGVAPETGEGRELVLVPTHHQQCLSVDEIRRDAGFDGRDAHATHLNAPSRPLVKGIRRNLQGECDTEFCLRPDFIAGVKLLAEFGFTFDLCIRHDQLPAVAKLVRSVPNVTFILNHFGKPDVRGKKTEPWATDLKVLAVLPNVVCKISGLTTEADWKNWQPADLKFYFETARECFGFDRLMFGGDWPVATLATSYDRWFETVREFFSFASQADLTKLFQTNAERIYRV